MPQLIAKGALLPLSHLPQPHLTASPSLCQSRDSAMPAAANFKHEVSVGLPGGPLLYPHKKQCCQLVPHSETVWPLMLPHKGTRKYRGKALSGFLWSSGKPQPDVQFPPQVLVPQAPGAM